MYHLNLNAFSSIGEIQSKNKPTKINRKVKSTITFVIDWLMSACEKFPLQSAQFTESAQKRGLQQMKISFSVLSVFPLWLKLFAAEFTL